MVFHEITEPAIRAAAEDPRDLDNDLVDAQETRRILDRLYGYEVSRCCGRRSRPKLSAGRVQSVATRIIVQRERERMAFRSADYWDIVAELTPASPIPAAAPPMFPPRLVTVDGRGWPPAATSTRQARSRKPDEVLVLDQASAGAGQPACAGRLTVASVEEKPYTRRPYRRS